MSADSPKPEEVNLDRHIARYSSYIRDDLGELKDTISLLVPSKSRAYRYAKNLKGLLIFLGLLVGIIGVVLTAADSLKITDTAKSWLSFATGLLGFIITFVTTNFDPVKFRQRTINLGQVITEFNEATKQFDGALEEYLAIREPTERLQALKQLEEQVDRKKNELMLKARVLKASL